MGEKTAIAWTDHTFSPWWGCQRVSPACEHCYAEAFAHRLGFGSPPPDQGPPRPPKPLLWGPRSDRRMFGEAHWREPEKWNAEAQRDGRRHRVFSASMADVFEDRRDLVDERARLWRLINSTPWLDWQLLTKRPENLLHMVPWCAVRGAEPWPNVWLGTTAEDQHWADKRIPHLLAVPAVVHFVSYEPALGPVDFRRWLPYGKVRPLCPCEGPADDPGPHASACHYADPEYAPERPFLDWIIAGGESGGRARPYALAWGNAVADQCHGAGVAFFHKQLGARPIDTSGQAILRLKDRHGADRGEWPDTVTHVRQFPEVHP